MDSWARHLVTVPLSTQVYKGQWITLQWSSHPIQGEVEIPLVASCPGFMLSAGLLGYLARMQTLTFTVGLDVCTPTINKN